MSPTHRAACAPTADARARETAPGATSLARKAGSRLDVATVRSARVATGMSLSRFDAGARIPYAVGSAPGDPKRALVFPSPRGGYVDLHNFRNRSWKPAQRAAGIAPVRRVSRSAAHVRDVRPARRHLHLRPLPLHGNKPGHDR